MTQWRSLIIVFCLSRLLISCSRQNQLAHKTDEIPTHPGHGEQKVKVEIKRESFFCNVREYLNDNVRFTARPIMNGNNYRILCVGTPKKPYMGFPALKLKLPDGTIIDTKSLERDDLLNKYASSIDPSHEPVYDQKTKTYNTWPKEAQLLRLGPWIFVFIDRQLVSFSVFYRQDEQWRWTGYVPAIGISGGDVMFAFPLKQDDVLRIFGKPDIIREFLEE